MKKSFSNKIAKTFLSSAVVLSAIANPVSVFAQTYDELIDQQTFAIENLTAQEATLVDELNAFYAELEEIEAKAGELMTSITEQAENLEKLAQENEELQEAIDNRQNLLDEQARAVQVTNGSTNYLAYVASAKDVKDFVGRVDTVRRMVTSNKELLAQQKTDQETLASKQEELETVLDATIQDRIELEQLKGEYIEKTQATEEAYNNVLNDKAIAQSTREALINEKAAYEAEQARIAAEQEAAQQAALEAAQAQAEADALAAQEAAQLAEQAQAEAQAAQAAAEQAANAEQVAQETQEAVAPEVQVVEEVVYNQETGQEEVVQTEVYVEPTFEEPVVEATQSVEQAQAEAQAAQERAEQAQAAAQAAQETAAASQANANSLIANAEQYIGTPYVWGGKSPSGFDCSGFAQYVYQETYGKDIGGWTGAQEHAGTKISVDQAQAGDLYFWGEPGSTYHVAIATGNGNYIHSPQPGESVTYSQVNGYFQPSFAVRVN